MPDLLKLGDKHPRIRETTFARLRVDAEEKLAPNGQPFDEMFIFSTERLASDGGVIYVDGWRTDEYEKNPRFISQHDANGYKAESIIEQAAGQTVATAKRNDLPVDLTMNGKGLVGWVRFAQTQFGRDLRTLYADGDLRACSVRWDWQTEEVRNPYEEEVMLYGDNLWWVVTRCDLMECSAVILGADPGALAIRGRDDLGVPDFVTPREITLRPEVRIAMSRCRQKGIEIPAVERMVNQLQDSLPIIVGETRQQDRAMLDTTALTDALGGLDGAIDMLDSVVDALPNIRDAFESSRAELVALTSGEEFDGDESGSDAEDDEERAIEDAEPVQRSVIDEIRESANELRESVERIREDLAAGTPPAPAADASAESEGAGAVEVEESGEVEGGSPESEEPVAEADEEVEEEVTEPVAEGDEPEADEPEDVTASDDVEDGEEAVDLESIFAADGAAA